MPVLPPPINDGIGHVRYRQSKIRVQLIYMNAVIINVCSDAATKFIGQKRRQMWTPVRFTFSCRFGFSNSFAWLPFVAPFLL